MTISFNDVFGSGVGATKVWASGMTVAQYAYVVSPADNEIYQRVTASGGGTTDPADDVTNYLARSYTRTAALQSPAVLANSGNAAANFANGAIKTSPSLTASTRTKVLGLTGLGDVQFLAIKGGVSSTTHRIEVIVDGRAVLDASSLGLSDSQGVACIGGFGFGYPSSSNNPMYTAQPTGRVKFRRSFDVYLTQSAAGSPTIAHIFASEA